MKKNQKKGIGHTLCRVPHTTKHTWEQTLPCVTVKAHGKGAANITWKLALPCAMQ
jgi:hypothetical protein